MAVSYDDFADFLYGRCSSCRVTLQWFKDEGPELAQATCPCCGEKLSTPAAGERKGAIFQSPTRYGTACMAPQKWCRVHCYPRCSFSGCYRRAAGKGLCKEHLAQRRSGRPLRALPRPGPPPVRLSLRLPPKVLAGLQPDPASHARAVLTDYVRRKSR
jgi:hypothetical protein